MFKKLLQRIIDSEYPVQEVFYGENGIDMEYQRDKITYKEYEMLLALCIKIDKLKNY